MVDFRCGLVACVLGASCWLWWLVVVAVASWCWCWFCYWEVSTVTQAVLFLLGSLNGDPGRTLFYWEVSTVTQAVHFTVLESLNGDPGRTLFTGKSNGDPGRTLQESSELTSGLSQRFTQAVHCLGTCVTDTNNLCISIQIN